VDGLGAPGSKVISRAVEGRRGDGEYEDFLTGFVIDDARSGAAPSASRLRMTRPLLVTDDAKGTLWRIFVPG